MSYSEQLEKHIELLESQLAEAQQQLAATQKHQPPGTVLLTYRDGNNGIMTHIIDAGALLQCEELLLSAWQQMKYEHAMRKEIQPPKFYIKPPITPFPTIGNGI
jgi:hypothetical protein